MDLIITCTNCDGKFTVIVYRDGEEIGRKEYEPINFVMLATDWIKVALRCDPR